MSGGRLQMKLIYGLEVLLAERLGYQLLAVVVHQVLGRLLGLYMNQSIYPTKSIGERNSYI